ncbi:prolyl oligopeptidase family serine peptidase [Paenibacillus sp. GCM10023248]|uniref:S9 family peptidase n=1 Tax=unclassified Paenibacillus TaxID=185978 RepID=UPI002379027E|nr:prolyl oligopeptidase family serine peptidase [Paenibacillus sp. MAHUQ-63]MDD9268387.1 prolyl oligopeptidase family serine peptidase [Paenibacillus sp. MAHUQ-63]
MDGGFHPDDAVTRGDAAIWLRNALHAAKPKALNGFTDVPATSPYAEAVNSLKELNIVQGDGGKYEPESPLTREQMASLLVRAFKLNNNGIQTWLKDENAIGMAHRDDVVKLKQHWITEQLTFQPKDQVTRAQLVLFLYRTLSQQEEFTQGAVTLDDFLQLPDKIQLRLSPDSQSIAYLHPWENRMNLYVQKLGQSESVRLTSSKDENIQNIFWVTNQILVYSVDSGGSENTHIHAVQVDGSNDRDLTPFKNVKSDLLDIWPAKNEKDYELLITMNRRDTKVMDVVRINLMTGELNMYVQNPGNVEYWVADNWGQVRAALARDGEKTSLLYREDDEKEFEKIATFDRNDTFIPVMFTYDNNQLYAASSVARNTEALVQYDPAAKKETNVLYVNDEVDINSVKFSFKKKAIVAVSYETDEKHRVYLDEEFKSTARSIEDQLQTTRWDFAGPIDKDLVLVHTYSDKSYGSYYLFDQRTGKLEKITDVAPKLNADKLSDMKPISFKSRDGLTIHGYLTLPKGVAANKLPVIVHPHGGPWTRDSWGYNMDVQLLANQGYAVLQLNYRGSDGYGKVFLHAGDKQWGAAMQNDITDGVNWLVQRGIADPERIGIYGASYGGYATLAGMTFTPDLYAAGVDVVGPSNLLTFLSTMPPYWELGRAQMYLQVGDPLKDRKLLEAASPLLHADKIKSPLMIVQGVNDPRVKQAESDQMVAALRKLEVDVPYMLKSNEGHGYYKLENERDFYEALIHFLNTYVKNKQ